MAKHSAEVQKIYTVMGPAAHMPVAMQISELEHVLQNAVFWTLWCKYIANLSKRAQILVVGTIAIKIMNYG